MRIIAIFAVLGKLGLHGQLWLRVAQPVCGETGRAQMAVAFDEVVTFVLVSSYLSVLC